MTSEPTGDGEWRVTASGTLTNQSAESVEIMDISNRIEVTSEDGATSTEQVSATASPRTIAAGGRATFSGTATMRSSSPPRYLSTSVLARWADPAVRDRCERPG